MLTNKLNQKNKDDQEKQEKSLNLKCKKESEEVKTNLLEKYQDE